MIIFRTLKLHQKEGNSTIQDHNSSESSDSAFNDEFHNKYSLEHSNNLSAVSSIFNRKYTVQIEEEYL